MRGPKRRAFAVRGGEQIDASHALAGAGLYEYGGRAVHRKRRAGAPATEDRSWYFAFAPVRRGGLPDCAVAAGAPARLTPTQLMLQAILCDKRFVQCRIDGAAFSTDLTDVERGPAAAVGAFAGPRFPDVRARAVRSSDQRLNGRPLDVAIAVTGPARGPGAFAAVRPGGPACLEICVDRDERREADPDALEAHLRAGLLAGAFRARWLAGPDGTPAALRPVEDVRRLLGLQRARARDELARAQVELAAAQELLRLPEPLPEDDELADRAALAAVEAEWEALLDLAERYDREHDGGVLVRAVADVVAPALRDPRLRTRAQRLARIRAQLRALGAPRNAGLVTRAAALERAVYARMSDEAVRRAGAASRAAVAAASIAGAERHLGEVAAYLGRLDALDRAGVRALAFPPGTSIRATIAYEHHRRFGAPAPAGAPVHAAS